MPLIYPIKGISPTIGKNTFIAENATIVGDVVMGDNCSVWFNAVIRGDVHSIRIGDNVNIQDGAIIHCTYQKHPVTIGNNVSIAHSAIVNLPVKMMISKFQELNTENTATMSLQSHWQEICDRLM